MGVDESFKVEVEIDGVYIGNFEAVGHHGVGAGASANVEEVVFLSKSADVPIDEEVGGKSQLVDHLHFFF